MMRRWWVGLIPGLLLGAVVLAAPPRTAVLDFARADSPGGVDPALADFSRAVQAKLFTDEHYAWVERQEFERIMREADPGGTNGFDPATAVRLGRLLQAELLLKGDVVPTGGKPAAELAIEVIDLRRAEVLARRAVPMTMNSRQKLHPTAENLAASTAAARAALDEARSQMEKFAGMRTLAPLYFRNTGASDRLDFLEERLRTAMVRAAASASGLRVLEFPRTSEAGGESSLVLAGLTATDPQAWQSVADCYVWGSFQEERADGVAFDDVPVTVVLQVATKTGAVREVRWNGAVKALPEGLEVLARGVVQAAGAPAGTENSRADERARIAADLQRRAAEAGRQIVQGGFQFQSSIAGRQLFAYRVRQLEVACFFDPLNAELQQQRLGALWGSLNPFKPLQTPRGQWLRLADYRTQAARFPRRPDGTLDGEWPTQLEESARQAIELLQQAEGRPRETGISVEEIHRQLGVMLEQWSDILIETRQASEKELKPPAWYAAWPAQRFKDAGFMVYLHDPIMLRAALEKTWVLWEPVLGALLKTPDPEAQRQASQWSTLIFSIYAAFGDQDRATALMDAAWNRGKAPATPGAAAVAAEKPREPAPARVDRPWAPLAKQNTPAQFRPAATNQPVLPIITARIQEIDPRTIRAFRRSREFAPDEDLLRKEVVMRVNALAWSAGKLLVSENGPELPAELGPRNPQGDQYLWSYDPALRTSELLSPKLGGHSSVQTIQPVGSDLWLGLAADGVWRLEAGGAIQRFQGQDGLQSMRIRDAVSAGDELFFLGGTVVKPTISIFSLTRKTWSGVQVEVPTPLPAWMNRFITEDPQQPAPPFRLAAQGDVVGFSGLWTAFFNRTTKQWVALPSANAFSLPMTLTADEKGFWFTVGSFDYAAAYLADPANPTAFKAVRLPGGTLQAAVHDGPWLWVAVNGGAADTQLALVDKRSMACVGVLKLPMHDVTCLAVGGGRIWAGGRKTAWAPGMNKDGYVLAEISELAPVGAVTEKGAAPVDFPVSRAVWRGDLAAVERLLAEKFDPNAVPRRGWTPLMAAAAAGRSDLVKALLAAGADPNKISGESETALQQAVIGGDATTIRLLLDRHAKPNLPLVGRITDFGRVQPVRLEPPGSNRPSHVRSRDFFRESATPRPASIVPNSTFGISGNLMPDMSANLPVRLMAQTPLALAAKAGRADLVELLLKAGADPNLADVAGDTPLLHALRHRQYAVARQLLVQGAKAELAAETGETPAALVYRLHENEALSEALLRALPMASRETEATTLLTLAAASGQLRDMEKLRALGGDLGLRIIGSETPLSRALHGDQGETVQWLLTQQADGLGARFRSGDLRDSESAIIDAAVRNNRPENFSRLLDLGLNINQIVYGYPLAARAAREKHFAVFKLLRERGADLNLRGSASVEGNDGSALGFLSLEERARYLDAAPPVVVAGWSWSGADARRFPGPTQYVWEADPAKETQSTRLMAACKTGDLSAAAGALAAGAEIDVVNKEGRTPLLEAMMSRSYEVARWLVEEGAAVNRPSRGGYSALSFAVEAGNAEMMDYLVQAGADPNVFGDGGLPPLVNAIQLGRLDLMEQLFAAGANPSVTGHIRQRRENALSMALWKGRTDVVDLLLAKGVNPRGQTYEFIQMEGKKDVSRFAEPSLLMFAAASGKVELVEKMVRLGQNPKLRAYGGYDALTWAAGGGKTEVVKFLLPLSEPKGHALAMARKNGHDEIVRLLVEAGYRNADD